MEKQKFKNYLLEKGYSENTTYSYSNSINSISEHIAELRGDAIDLYKIYDISRLKKISDTYSSNGNHSEFGNKSNGTVRNAIARFVEFRQWENDNQAEDEEGLSIKEQELEDKLTFQEDIMGTLVLLKLKIDEINKNRNLITTIIIGQVIIIGLIIYILFQL